MAGYYSLITRAVAVLDTNNGESRRALYEHARTALLTQLRSTEPALNKSDIMRERLALEESIRKVEAESARKFIKTPRQRPPIPPAENTEEYSAPPPPRTPPSRRRRTCKSRGHLRARPFLRRRGRCRLRRRKPPASEAPRAGPWGEEPLAGRPPRMHRITSPPPRRSNGWHGVPVGS